jgi:hypothetical protein
MATYKHLRSSTANKRPTTSITDGQLAINTNTASPGLFFKDSAGTGIVKVGPVHVGTTAPNATPAAGGSSGNYLGEQWLDTSVSPSQMKVWNGSAWVGIVADELPVSKLQDGDARQLLQTDAAGTGVEWTSNVDVPGTLDVTSTATFDSIARHPLGSAAAPTLTFTGDPNTGIYSPGADQVAVATNGAGRVFVDASGNVQIGSSFAGIANGSGLEIERSTTSALRLTGASGVGCEFFNTGTLASIQTRSTIPFTIQTNELERLRITSAGLVGIGTSSPEADLHINDATGLARLRFTGGAVGADNFEIGQAIVGESNSGFSIYDVDEAETRFVIDSSGRVGIGTTSPASLLTSYAGNVSTLGAKASTGLLIENNGSVGNVSQIGLGYTFSSTNHPIAIAAVTTSGAGSTRADLVFATRDLTTDVAPTERARIDSSGRLLIGTSTSSATVRAVFQDNSGSTGPGHVLLATSSSVPTSAEALGRLRFSAANHVESVQIEASRDGGTWTAGSSQPSKLTFSTTADGASSPTERMRINAGGNFLINQTTTDDPAGTNTQGLAFGSAGWISNCRDGATPVLIGRKGADGTLVEFFQDGTVEGSISVSGTTVSYNGAHLSRWSQLPNGAEREEILRGTVLSNIDEMCEWGEEENEQLNRMKVSDVEGDKNASGVFQAWDDDDDTYINDFYCAMTGDFIIRIAEGITVERGDLLMSAGDGTAKPQDDDIIRSKTIAKVASTNVSCTYDDGSYCVPCVLMAC